jgi:hypothetical protein
MPIGSALAFYRHLVVSALHMPKVMHAVMEDVCNEQHCTAEQKKSLQAAADEVISPTARPAQPGRTGAARKSKAS